MSPERRGKSAEHTHLPRTKPPVHKFCGQYTKKGVSNPPSESRPNPNAPTLWTEEQTRKPPTLWVVLLETGEAGHESWFLSLLNSTN